MVWKVFGSQIKGVFAGVVLPHAHLDDLQLVARTRSIKYSNLWRHETTHDV